MDPSFLLGNGYVLCEEDEVPDEEFEYEGIGEELAYDGLEYGTVAPNGGALTLDVRGLDGKWYSRYMEDEPGWKCMLDDVDAAMEELVAKYHHRSRAGH